MNCAGNRRNGWICKSLKMRRWIIVKLTVFQPLFFRCFWFSSCICRAPLPYYSRLIQCFSPCLNKTWAICFVQLWVCVERLACAHSQRWTVGTRRQTKWIGSRAGKKDYFIICVCVYVPAWKQINGIVFLFFSWALRWFSRRLFKPIVITISMLRRFVLYSLHISSPTRVFVYNASPSYLRSFCFLPDLMLLLLLVLLYLLNSPCTNKNQQQQQTKRSFHSDDFSLHDKL